MKQYNRVMLGSKSKFAAQCREQGYIGVHYGFDIDLTGEFPENWRDFNKKYIPYYLEKHPEKSKIAAGLACGMTWTLCRGLQVGAIILSPDGDGNYFVGEITSAYSYRKGDVLPQSRNVKWYDMRIERAAMSEEMQRSTNSTGTLCDISKYADELQVLIGEVKAPRLISSDPTVEDPRVFALEKHLEDFLVANWNHTELGKQYNIFEDEGELVGQQYPSDTGPIDILAISKDGKKLLVVELKKGRASDNVVGQIQRYMGYVKEELAEVGQTVEGIIIALEDDLRIRRALSVTTGISFYRYEVSFKLKK